MTSNQTGRLIGAIFGLVFVVASAGNLPTAVGVPLRVLAIGTFVGLFIALRRGRTPRAAADRAAAPLFGRGYRLVVAAEVVVGLAGLVLINPVLHATRASVAWIALVVGLHFFGLAVVWRMPSIRLLAAAMSACGGAGLVLAVCGASAAVIAAVAGIAPGVMLLGSVWWSVRADKARRPAGRLATPEG
ncbi:hypothetical protein ACFVHB_03175 [Kitasatospora sp. NPDC127111]|uniref:hypothetical protein n=1 Tax=Kitasatospora sp. NPDC127111 TaxID=3345363 RepID=UPI003627C632